MGQAIGTLVTYQPYINKNQCQNSMLYVFLSLWPTSQNTFSFAFLHSQPAHWECMKSLQEAKAEDKGFSNDSIISKKKETEKAVATLYGNM